MCAPGLLHIHWVLKILHTQLNICIMNTHRHISTLTVLSPPLYLHCPKNNLNLSIKTEPVTVGAAATVRVYVWFQCVNKIRTYCTAYRCICSNCDRLGFYAEIHFIFGTVYTHWFKFYFWDSVHTLICAEIHFIFGTVYIHTDKSQDYEQAFPRYILRHY